MPSILVVDDNPAVLQSLELFFQFEGYAIHLAADGAAALKVLAETPVDAVLLDVEMPVLSGIAACHAIRQDPALKHVPVIMMTGRPLRDLVERARAAGAAQVLAKPFDLDSLRKVLSELISPAALPAVPEVK
jgi:CheY-like chemotaxis protein